MHRLLLLGLNHTTAPLEVREKLAFNAAQRDAALQAFGTQFKDCEVVLLSTCNRVELYAARPLHESPTPDDLLQFLSTVHGCPPEAFAPHLYHKSDREAIAHLFSVTSSLDSMVLGETQILGQVREAYEAAAKLKLTGSLLNPLFQRAVAVGKQVMHQTPLAEGRMSVARVAVDCAGQIFETFADKVVLSIGAGKMSELMLQGLMGLGPRKLIVCNRSAEKAAALAQRFGGVAAPFESLRDQLVQADMVVTSTGAAEPIITRRLFEQVLRQRRYRPIFLIDIAVPRDVEASTGDLEHVYLYNLDDLQRVVLNTQNQRQEAVAAAKLIVQQHVEGFATWNRQRLLGPVIHRLYSRYHAIAQEEVERTVNKLNSITPAERTHLEDLARRIVNKLLHHPVQTLRDHEAGHVANAQYLHAMEKLFQLSEAEVGGDELSPPDSEVEPPAAEPPKLMGNDE